MKPVYQALQFLDEERIVRVSENADSGLVFDLYVQIHSEKFVDYQREIFEEYAANFLDKARDPALAVQDIDHLLEENLKNLNAKLQTFSEKLRDMPKCELR